MTADIEFELNGLTKDVLREALLRHNYFPRQHDHKEELPPIFHTQLFTPTVAERLLGVKERKDGYDIFAVQTNPSPKYPSYHGHSSPKGLCTACPRYR